MSKTKVMVVEDESIVAIDISQRLDSLGYEVSATVSSGEKAIEMAEKTKPDIILMDIVLKGNIDGIEAAEVIGEKFKIPVVYLTAYSDEKTLKRAKYTGPFGYIIKPFEDRELHSVIEVALYKNEMDTRLKESEEKYRIIVNSMQDILFTLDLDERCTMISENQIKRYGVRAEDFIGKTTIEMFGDDGKIHQEANKRVLSGESIVYNWSGNIAHKPVYFQTSLSPLKSAEGELIGITGILRDISDLKKAEDALSHETEVNMVLAKLGKQLLNPTDIKYISKHVLKYAKDLTKSEFCFVGYVEPDTRKLKNFSLTKKVWEKCHIDNIFENEFSFNDVGGLWGWVLDNNKPILTNSPHEDNRSVGTPEGHIPIKNFLGVPAMLNDERIGMIALANSKEDYTENDLAVVQQLADLYALAIHRKLSEEKLRESEEKNRIIVEKFLKIVSEMMIEIR